MSQFPRFRDTFLGNVVGGDMLGGAGPVPGLLDRGQLRWPEPEQRAMTQSLRYLVRSLPQALVESLTESIVQKKTGTDQVPSFIHEWRALALRRANLR